MAAVCRFLRENVCDPANKLRCCRPTVVYQSELPVVKDLVLVGGGHAHVHVLRMLGMQPMAGVRVTLVTRDLETPYSGMLPGHVAGHYDRDECHVDLAPLAQFAKARVIHAAAVGLDLDRKRVKLAGPRPDISYDVLSIDIGSAPMTMPVSTQPDGSDGAGDAAVTPVKPIDGFGARWQRVCDRLERRLTAGARAAGAAAGSGQPEFTFSLAVVGGGAGGVELALAIQFRFRAMLREHNWAEAGSAVASAAAANDGRPTARLNVSLLTRGNTILPTHNRKVQGMFTRIFSERGIELQVGCEVSTVVPPAAGAAEGSTGGALRSAAGREIAFDECIWCTGGAAQAWLRETELPLDDGGFIAVEPTLQCLGAARSAKLACVFACGDVAAVIQHPRPKAGVFAVRQGPPLLRNLRRVLVNKRAVPFTPQKTFLSIISTGDRYAVWSRGMWAREGARVWRAKDWIDRKWMRMYQQLPQMSEPEVAAGAVARASGESTLAVLRAAPMRCGGCGSKVGATVLSSVMARLRREGLLTARPEVLVGLDSPDDAAVVTAPKGGMATVHTVDFFRSFIEDPYVFGRIAANHALSDCHAMCAEPVSALAMVVVPYGLDSKVEDLLFQVMAGACSALGESNCALVGGHTTEGPELTLGFAINGVAQPADVLSKGGMCVGDKLVLTKPVGTGALFAAAMRSQARGPWIGSALQAMQASNMRPAAVVREHGATCATDVTGFGLLGHLVEMTRASGVHVRFDLGAVPFLEGARECVRRGIFSSLQGSNLRLRRAVGNAEAAAAAAPEEYALAFDPQTAGGVLACVPAARAQACIEALRAAGCTAAAIVGEVERSYGGSMPASGECVTCTWEALPQRAAADTTTTTTQEEPAVAHENVEAALGARE